MDTNVKKFSKNVKKFSKKATIINIIAAAVLIAGTIVAIIRIKGGEF